MPPTIVLVDGAFAESSSWNRVIDLLPEDTARHLRRRRGPRTGRRAERAAGPHPHSQRSRKVSHA
jgi:hypothetical protein